MMIDRRDVQVTKTTNSTDKMIIEITHIPSGKMVKGECKVGLSRSLENSLIKRLGEC